MLFLQEIGATLAQVQSSDNRSHNFGAKFLLKKLSASDFSYERKSAFALLPVSDISFCKRFVDLQSKCNAVFTRDRSHSGTGSP